MRKIVVLLAALSFVLGSCTSTGGTGGTGGTSSRQAKAQALNGVPDFVNQAYLNASEDVLVGIGTYKIGTDMSRMSMAKTMAETRARTDIARQLQSIVRDMVTDYTAASELDPKAAISFQESITQALSRADLRGTRTLAMNTHEGILWVVMEYSKSSAARDYSAASAAAKLAVPAAAAFDALSRMENAFGKAAAGGPVPVGE